MKKFREAIRRFFNPTYAAIMDIRELDRKSLDNHKEEILELMEYLTMIYGLEVVEYKPSEEFSEKAVVPGVPRKIRFKKWGKDFAKKFGYNPAQKKELLTQDL